MTDIDAIRKRSAEATELAAGHPLRDLHRPGAADDVRALLAEVDRLRAKLANLAMQRAGYRADWDAVQEVLSGALGSGADDGAGGGIAADVALLARQRDEARADNQRLRDGIKATADGIDLAIADTDNPHMTAEHRRGLEYISGVLLDLLGEGIQADQHEDAEWVAAAAAAQTAKTVGVAL